MEKMGVISRISKPTDWCTGMVVVPKANGKVRICVDLTRGVEIMLCWSQHFGAKNSGWHRSRSVH